MLDFAQLWSEAIAYDDFVAASAQHKGLWEGLYRLARLPTWLPRRLEDGHARRLLVLAEDWCGDASNTIPILAKWADTASGVELRILRRDDYPDIMNRYLTGQSRSIPIVIALDTAFREVGHWGPRPGELQAWVMANRGVVPKPELYPKVRRWYAHDRGETTLREVAAAAGIPLAASDAA